MIAIALMLAKVVPATTPSVSLHLICKGGGLRDDDDVQSVHAVSSDGKSMNGTVTENKKVSYSAQFEFVIEGDTGRVRWPMTMLPPLNRAHDGWTVLDQIKVSDDEIAARTKMNFANHPRFRIDRIHGTIEMAGWGANFSGSCEIYKPEADAVHAF